jgi:hypothetical protein
MRTDRNDDPWIGQLLSAEADRHQLDGHALLARVMTEVNASARSPRTDTAPPGRDNTLVPVQVGSSRPRPRRRAVRRARILPAALAAAALAAIATAGSLLSGPGERSRPRQDTIVHVQGRLPESAKPGTSAPSTVPGTRQPTPEHSTQPAPPTPRQIARGRTRLSVTAAPAGSSVTLPSSSSRDWVVLAGPGDAVVRPRGTQLITGPSGYGPNAAISASRFRLAWSGAAAGTTSRWWTETGAGAGFRVSAPAGASTGTLIIYLGAIGGPAHITARLDGGSGGGSIDLPANSGGCLLTVQFRAQGSQPDTVLVDISADPGAGVGIAAVELR